MRLRWRSASEPREGRKKERGKERREGRRRQRRSNENFFSSSSRSPHFLFSPLARREQLSFSFSLYLFLLRSFSDRRLPVSISGSKKASAKNAATFLALLFFFTPVEKSNANRNVPNLFLGAPQPRCRLVPRRAAARRRALCDGGRVGGGGPSAASDDGGDGRRNGVWRQAMAPFVFVFSQPLTPPPRPRFRLLLPLRLDVPLRLLLQVQQLPSEQLQRATRNDDERDDELFVNAVGAVLGPAPPLLAVLGGPAPPPFHLLLSHFLLPSSRRRHRGFHGGVDHRRDSSCRPEIPGRVGGGR